MENPCRSCPVHLRGDDKSGPTCMGCEARVAYVAAIGSGHTDVSLPPPPKGPPEPSATFSRRSYKIGPYHRKPRKQRPPGRPTTPLNVMAARRVALGISQGRLADEAGSSVRTIAAIESGSYARTPRALTLNAIARVLDIPADMLLMPITPTRRAAP
jgi:DNA-binding XRE family transcriptional regulator